MILTNVKVKDKEHLKLRCLVKVGPGDPIDYKSNFHNSKRTMSHGSSKSEEINSNVSNIQLGLASHYTISRLQSTAIAPPPPIVADALTISCSLRPSVILLVTIPKIGRNRRPT